MAAAWRRVQLRSLNEPNTDGLNASATPTALRCNPALQRPEWLGNLIDQSAAAGLPLVAMQVI